jgi:phasin family protein
MVPINPSTLFEATIMSEYFNTQALALSKNFADATFKAHTLAVEGLERVTNLNLKAIESNVAATVDFLSEAAEVRDFDGLKTIFPKGVNLVKDSAEKLYANGQEVLGISVKTGEALSQLAKGSLEVANDNFKKQVNAAQADFNKQVNAAAKKVAR